MIFTASGQRKTRQATAKSSTANTRAGLIRNATPLPLLMHRRPQQIEPPLPSCRHHGARPFPARDGLHLHVFICFAYLFISQKQAHASQYSVLFIELCDGMHRPNQTKNKSKMWLTSPSCPPLLEPLMVLSSTISSKSVANSAQGQRRGEMAGGSR